MASFIRHSRRGRGVAWQRRAAQARAALGAVLLRSSIGDARARTVLDAAAALLESRYNAEQPYGEWGVLCAFPRFRRRTDTRAKTAFAYRYHNSSDWPYLSGLYAGERLRRGLSGWRYPLTRWWQTCLGNGWMGWRS